MTPSGDSNINKSKYRFVDHEWLATADGFRMPSDVYYGNILLGVIESKPDGYTIELVMKPLQPQFLLQSSHNLFKTKLEAAEMLHKMWVYYRKRKS